jgi:hypothetical protein
MSCTFRGLEMQADTIPTYAVCCWAGLQLHNCFHGNCEGGMNWRSIKPLTPPQVMFLEDSVVLSPSQEDPPHSSESS